MLTRRVLIVLSLTVTFLYSVAIGAQTTTYAIASRIEPSSFSGLGARPLIASYALSPEGTTVAFLVLEGPEVGAPLWLITKDLASGRIISRLNLGSSTFPGSGFALQVLYTNGNKLLIVQDLRTIRVFDSTTLALIRTIPNVDHQAPLYVLAASENSVVVCAFGSPVEEFGVHVTPVQLEVVDVGSGKMLSDWQSEDVPQALSADGTLIAISAAHVEKGVLPLTIHNSQGKLVAKLTGAFSFRKVADSTKPLGRVRGIFITNQSVLLSPDENVDESGHQSGDDFKIVNLSNAQVEQVIRPRHYGPTGELAISGDQKKLLVVSWYVPAAVYRNREKRFPADTGPAALVFDVGTDLRMSAEIPISNLSLNLDGWQEARRPQFSSQGLVVAFAKDNGITVEVSGHLSSRNP